MTVITAIDESIIHLERAVELTVSDATSLEIVFKIQETCNINCKYCYMYNVGNELYKQMPTRASIETCEHVAGIIIDQFKNRNPRFVRLILHGGEPMLMTPAHFDERMSAITSKLRRELNEEQLSKIQYSMQTNATLVSEAWLAQIEKWELRLGVSIDGYEEAHDQYRVDKKDRGTHANVVSGIRKLQDANRDGRIAHFGALCVINPDADGARVYDHLTRELGFTGFDFLLPFMNWDSVSSETLEKTRQYLLSAFAAWRRDAMRGRHVEVRIFKRIMNSLRWGPPPSEGKLSLAHYVMVVESNGAIQPEESLRPAYDGRFAQLTVHDHGLEDVLADARFYTSIVASFQTAPECDDCALLNQCRSGQSVGRIGMRYQTGQLFDRKSVYCDVFKDLYVQGAAMMIDHGRSGQSPLLADLADSDWQLGAA
nr:radical SAM protein [Caulobacter radicis]